MQIINQHDLSGWFYCSFFYCSFLFDTSALFSVNTSRNSVKIGIGRSNDTGPQEDPNTSFTPDRVGVFEIKPDRPLFTFFVLTSPAIAVYLEVVNVKSDDIAA